MLSEWVILVTSFGYLGILFGIAYLGDKRADAGNSIISNPYIYALSIAVYCTTWTFYGSVGRAAVSGVGFLPIYLGPTLIAAVWWFLLRKIIRISKTFRITSIADFLASRFGKSAFIGGLVTVIAIAGIIPYISLQLKAVSSTFTVLHLYPALEQVPKSVEITVWSDTALYVAIIMALFSILFGTRHLDATERHEGVVAAIAFESLVKLLAFLAVGFYVVFVLFEKPGDIFALAADSAPMSMLTHMKTSLESYSSWFVLTLISVFAVMFLPRQFQVLVVENVNEEHVKKASWLFPLYLFAINLFVVPIALAGKITFFGSSVDADIFVLTLPLTYGEKFLALFVYIGGLSAATGMVIVETIALSTMVSNDLVVPVLLRIKALQHENLSSLLLNTRRLSILLVLLLGYLYFRFIGEAYALVSIGLISFAAVAQFAPPFLLGLFWKGASRRGAAWGLSIGFAIWMYTLIFPSLAIAGWIPISFIDEGLFGIPALRPYHLFNIEVFDPITHSVVWSLLANTGILVIMSLTGQQSVQEKIQAKLFVDVFKQSPMLRGSPVWGGTARVSDLTGLLVRLLGQENCDRALERYERRHNISLSSIREADAGFVEFVERELSGAIGAASARVMISTVVEGEDVSIDTLMRVLDETSQVIEYSHRLEEKSRELETATQELKRTNERLKELDRLKDEFISTVSHELRTPLTSIRAFSEILCDDIDMDREKRRELLNILVTETERLTRLVNEILDFTKLESGTYSWAFEEVDLVKIIRESLRSSGQLAQSTSAQVSEQLPRKAVTIVADRDRIMQVIINLVTNAIKYSGENPKVEIRLHDEGPHVRIEVADNGPGIPHEEQERIFEKFHQITDRRTGKPHGTGLGLSICKRIVEYHRGRIFVQSSPGHGATFIVILPKKQVAAQT